MTDQPTLSLYKHLATDKQIDRALQALIKNQFQAVVVNTGVQARQYVLSMIPEGSEVYSGASQTLDQIGLTAAIEESGRYNAIRPQLRKLDRATQGREIRKLRSSPDFMLGSVHAVTMTGQVVVGSGGGSQIGPYASGAGVVIWVVGAQKIVPTLADALNRLQEYTFMLEDERMRSSTGRSAQLNQILIINGSLVPGRLRMVIVKEPLGF